MRRKTRHRTTVVSVVTTTVLTLALSIANLHTATAQSNGEIEAQRLSLERQKLDIERDKLAEERKRTKLLEAAEDRFKRTEQDRWMLWAAAIGTPLTIIASLVVAVASYRFQALAAMNQLDAQFKLKAAEIVMAARSANQIHNKAMALADLLPKELAHLGNSFDPKKFKLGQSVERRQALIELLAAHPNNRRDIIRTWAILFPHDANDWLEPLMKDEGLNGA